jgi:hypothetical protein
LDPWSQIFFSSSTVRHDAHVFCGFTTTVSASLATVNARQEPTVLSLICAPVMRPDAAAVPVTANSRATVEMHVAGLGIRNMVHSLRLVESAG